MTAHLSAPRIHWTDGWRRAFRKGDITINILGENRQFTHFFQAERKKERGESFYKKQRLEKEERKEFSITITLFRPRLFLFSFLLFSLLSEDHKAAKILDSRFSSETSDGSPSVGAGTETDGRTGGRRPVSWSLLPPSLSFRGMSF